MDQINNPSYTPTEWTVGDVITAEKMNNIENGIVNLSNGIAEASSSSGVKLYELVKETDSETGATNYTVYDADKNEVELREFFNVAYSTPESVVVMFHNSEFSTVGNVVNYYKPVRRVSVMGETPTSPPTRRSVEFSYVGAVSGDPDFCSTNTFVITSITLEGSVEIEEYKDQCTHSVFSIDVIYDTEVGSYLVYFSGKTCQEVMAISRVTPVVADITKSDNSLQCILNLKKTYFDQVNNKIRFCFESPSLMEECLVTEWCGLTDDRATFVDMPETWIPNDEA